jgi:hypothetical protein
VDDRAEPVAKRERLGSSVAKCVIRLAIRETSGIPDAEDTDRAFAEVLLKNKITAKPIIADIVKAPEFADNSRHETKLHTDQVFLTGLRSRK